MNAFTNRKSLMEDGCIRAPEPDERPKKRLGFAAMQARGED